MKKIGMVILIVSLCLLCISCNIIEENSQVTLSEEEKPEKLVVYTSGISHGFKLSDDPETEVDFEMYPSKAMIGIHGIGGELDCANGNIFAQALEDFSKETGIEIEVHFLEEYVGPSDCLQELVDQGKPLPDMLFVGKFSRYDYVRMAEQELLLDFTDMVEQDEALGDQYYQEVIRGGKIGEKQFILPVLFNLNAIITTDSFLAQLGMPDPGVNYSYEDYLHLFEESCLAVLGNVNKECLYEAAGNMVSGGYFPSVLIAAAYPSYWSSAQELLIEEETLASIFRLMSEYYKQEFAAIPDWESNELYENGSDMRAKTNSMKSEYTDAVLNNMGILLVGGRSGGGNFYNNLLTDATYFQSRYQANGESMILRGIPTKEDSNSYSANITQMAIGFQRTQYPEAVYALARYLMDYEYPMYYGFSVNREITQNQLEAIQNTYYTLYPDTWSSITAGFTTQEEVESQTEELEPLHAETVSVIENMLGHIAGAGIPYSPLEYAMFKSMLGGVHNQEYTPEEAARWIIEQLKEHQRVQSTLKPFYDAEYEHRLLRWEE